MGAKFNYKISHKSDRGRILEQIPSYAEMILKIKGLNISKEDRCLLSMMLCLGGRVSEILNVKWKDIIIKDNLRRPAIMADPNMFTVALCDNIEYGHMDIILTNLKGHKKKGEVIKTEYKTIPIEYNNVFMEPFIWIKEYLIQLKPYDPERKIFNYSRGQVWFKMKKLFGDGYFPHLMRHISATNDLRLGINLESLRKKLGHRTDSMFMFYSHLNKEDLRKDLEKIYGPGLEKISTDNKPLTPYQVVGALAAAREVREIGNDINVKKQSILLNPVSNKMAKVYITDQGRKMRDLIKQRINPIVVKKVEPIQEDILQVV